MSHKKVDSQGNIPFSWEDKPGVSKSSKVIHYDHHHHHHQYYCPIDVGSSKISIHDKKVPPPPPFLKQTLPKRSSSVKGLRYWWPQDPFLAAYKECTKNENRLSSESGGSKSVRKNKKKNIFSCKESCDVRDDNSVTLSNLPPLPKDGIRRRQEFVHPVQGF